MVPASFQCFVFAWILLQACAAVEPKGDRLDAVRAETLLPYTGRSIAGVDVSALDGKVMCGYQGWFNAEGDGADRGWVHWTKRRGPFADGNAKVDLWPDLSEFGAGERFPTGFKHADGRVAEVFSSFKEATVLRHFQWMCEHGIDGAFVQRFAAGLREPRVQKHANVVLAHCRAGANANGRAYAVMYDLSGLGSGRIDEVIDDWRALKLRMRITDDPAYVRHRGRPVVAVWGIGFSDDRAYTLAECRRLVRFLKDDPDAGGCTVMLGVPWRWRELKGDAISDSALHDAIQEADIVSPWTIGRYRTPDEVARHARQFMGADMAWCRERGLDYLPVVFPGFSWHNMHGGALDAIPRLRGRFLWSQIFEAKRVGAKMIYVAMFDEVDEGTAIFKCTNDVPVGAESRFIGYEGLPSDFYLRLTGLGGKLLRGEIPATAEIPR